MMHMMYHGIYIYIYIYIIYLQIMLYDLKFIKRTCLSHRPFYYTIEELDPIHKPVPSSVGIICGYVP